MIGIIVKYLQHNVGYFNFHLFFFLFLGGEWVEWVGEFLWRSNVILILSTQNTTFNYSSMSQCLFGLKLASSKTRLAFPEKMLTVVMHGVALACWPGLTVCSWLSPAQRNFLFKAVGLRTGFCLLGPCQQDYYFTGSKCRFCPLYTHLTIPQGTTKVYYKATFRGLLASPWVVRAQVYMWGCIGS